MYFLLLALVLLVNIAKATSLFARRRAIFVEMKKEMFAILEIQIGTYRKTNAGLILVAVYAFEINL